MQNKYFSIIVCFFLVVFVVNDTAQAGSLRERIKERRAAKKVQKTEDVPSYLNTVSIMHQGITRTYYIHVPDALQGLGTNNF